ncbi:MAG: TetR/AcrR family transcriptional regulator [Pseudomonadota bacterium]
MDSQGKEKQQVDAHESMEKDTTSEVAAENGWSARSRATRQKLIAAASKLIVEKGINSVSVVAVAKAAGITRPGAYYHFDTREALLNAVREQTDHQLVRTLSGSKDDPYLYSQAAEIAAEDKDTIYLRVQRMLEQGTEDVIIRSRHRGISRAKREKRLKAGVEPDVAAIISSTALVASFLAVSDFKQKSRRHREAKLFGVTNYQLIFDGALLPETLTNWPTLPRYTSTTNSFDKQFVGRGDSEKDGRKAKSIETRDVLMKAAMRLMAEVGEQAVSVSEVARRAGVTRPGAYYHFKKKEELIAAVEEKLDKELIYTLDRSFASRESFEDASDLISEDLSLLKIRIQQMLRDGAKRDPLIAHYRKLFRWHKKHGHLRDDLDPDMTAVITASASLVGLFLILGTASTPKEKAKQAKRFRKTYKVFVFKGIFTPETKREWPPPPELD